MKWLLTARYGGPLMTATFCAGLAITWIASSASGAVLSLSPCIMLLALPLAFIGLLVMGLTPLGSMLVRGVLGNPASLAIIAVTALIVLGSTQQFGKTPVEVAKCDKPSATVAFALPCMR